jgi:hypothetical protein
MGWRGTLRSVGAAMRAAERDALRRRKIEYKQQVAEEAAEAVDELEEHIDGLLTLHTDLGGAIDWVGMVDGGRPSEPERSYVRSRKLERQLQDFRSGPLDFLRGGSKKRFAVLEQKHSNAWDEDEAEFQRAYAKFLTDSDEWEADRSLARRVVAGERDALLEVISEHQSLTNESRVGTHVSFEVDDSYVHAKPEVHGVSIVPAIRRKQLASGMLSQTKMPVGEHHDLYQDYVASVALRVAGDLFNILPLQEVYVTCLVDMLDPKSGHQVKTPVVSVHFTRETFGKLNLASVDPSQALSNFRHNMRYKRTSGFQAVELLPRLQN